MPISDRTADPEAVELMENLDYSFRKQQGTYKRMLKLQRNYDNLINDYEWPTDSKIPEAKHFVMVENELADVFEALLLGLTRYIQMMPLAKGISAEQLDQITFALKSTLTYRMKMATRGLTTLKDCFKVGVGFGIVEPTTVTPPSTQIRRVTNGSQVLQTRVMGLGRPQRTLRFRYVNNGRVVVYPNGSDFNGDDRVDIAWFIDDYPEDQLRAMFDNQPGNEESRPLRGDAEAIIKEGRSYGLTLDSTIGDYIDKLGGKKQYLQGQSGESKNIRTRIPIVKCYENYANRHTWLALGKYVIYREEGQPQTMRCPLVKASAWPDSTRFFPMSMPEAYYPTAMSHNIWVNMMWDIFTYVSRRPLIYNKDAIKSMPEHGPDPRQAIPATGPVSNVAQYLQPPSLDAASVQFGDVLDKIGDDITGHRDFTEKNFTRGGAMSFQDFLSTTTARRRMYAAILQSGFIGDIASQVLAYLQVMSDEKGQVFRSRRFNRETGRTVVDERSITDEDLKASVEVCVDPAATRKLSAMDDQNRFAKYDRMIKSPYTDHYEVTKELVDDENEETRLLLPRDEVKRIQQERQTAETEGLRQQQTSVGQQAQQGAEA